MEPDTSINEWTNWMYGPYDIASTRVITAEDSDPKPTTIESNQIFLEPTLPKANSVEIRQQLRRITQELLALLAELED